ncbi:hypothetical protein CDD82_1111 [Ophiocordyceps australis]|uniref:LCCL domain-containing protein n=1 Tax=Ophiocordyceps australis TaxID=1399860 RepID=A0A2C5YJC9_9HYPO|nr:hypothetical protein CDD82_1111 [Ophiocordyceps australis]
MPEPYHDDPDETQPLMSLSARRKPNDGQIVETEAADNDSGPSVDRRHRQELDHHSEASSSSPPPSGDHGVDSPLSGHGVLQVDDSRQATPRFLQDERTSKYCKRIPYPVRRLCCAISRWARGPPDAQPYRIAPLLPNAQKWPLWLVNRLLPKLWQRRWLLFLYLSLWFITIVLVKRKESAAIEITGWGQASTISCGATYWGSDNSCGLDGDDCRPFTKSGFAFTCPANCRSYTPLNPRAVGDEEIIYKPLVVGGGDESATYRGDSYICGAAIHAGVVNNKNGGCGVVELVGRHTQFARSDKNGVDSIGFDSYFPLSFRFLADADCSAKDERWSLLAISVVFSVSLSLFTASSAVFFFSTFTALFITVGIATDAPPSRSVAALVSNLVGKFLPAAFVAWVIFDKVAKRTLKGLKAQVEKTVLWLGGCWVGALSNYTLGWIPIQRLNKHDLDQQPGAKAALAVIVIILVVIVVSQIWFLRKEGRLIRYLKLYVLFLVAIVIGLLLPALHLRLHHYIIALLLLPGTSMQTRPSLLYQGFLLGLFINGVARWGFDPVLQTSQDLQGDGQRDTLLPTIAEPTINLGNGPGSLSNVTFTWDTPADVQMYDGFSVLVNDVERSRSYFDDAGAKNEFTWSRNSSLDLNEYFRFAYMTGSMSGDYTKAGIWTADGKWRQMQPGPSK